MIGLGDEFAPGRHGMLPLEGTQHHQWSLAASRLLGETAGKVFPIGIVQLQIEYDQVGVTRSCQLQPRWGPSGRKSAHATPLKSRLQHFSGFLRAIDDQHALLFWQDHTLHGANPGRLPCLTSLSDSFWQDRTKL